MVLVLPVESVPESGTGAMLLSPFAAVLWMPQGTILSPSLFNYMKPLEMVIRGGY